MNENPEGAQTPLTPAPEAAAPAPATEAPAPAPAAPEPVAPAAPAAPKKKKTGLIIGLVLGFLAIVGGVVAILFIFVFNKSGDPASNAFQKLLNGDNRNIAVSGRVDVNTGTAATINYTAAIDSVAKAGTVSARINTNVNGLDAEVEVEARLTGDENVYLKVSGVKDIYLNALKQYGFDCDEMDCDSLISSSTSSSNDMFSGFLSLEDKWIKIEGAKITSAFTLPAGLKLDDISSHKNEVIDLYKKYPFIVSDTKDLKIAKKNDTLYKITIDYDKLASFANEAVKNSGQSVDVSQVKDAIEKAGDVYAEIDNNGNFTRLYAGGQDITISYPTNITVSAPEDYTTSSELESIFGQIFSSFSGGSSNYNYYNEIDDCDIDDDGCLDYSTDFDWESYDD